MQLDNVSDQCRSDSLKIKARTYSDKLDVLVKLLGLRDDIQVER